VVEDLRFLREASHRPFHQVGDLPLQHGVSP
jgi:hypothetical protein